MPMDDVPDSTDWLATPLACLAEVEAAMRCQVCKDFYKTPMITTCSHTFCSICIRRALSNDGQCPLCRAPEQELRLRSNWSMEESVEAFSKARPAALTVAHDKLNTSAIRKRRSESGATTEHPASPKPKRLRTSARQSNYRIQIATETSPGQKQRKDTIPASDEDEGSNNEDDSDSEYNPENADGLVPCPSCQNRMKDWQVFQHLENCPGPMTKTKTSDISPAIGTVQTQQQRRRATEERLPALNYSMLKEQALRKKLAELGISNQGPRFILEKRHKEWITIWNANCDSALPRKRPQLLQDLDTWERTQGNRTSANAKSTLSGTTIKDKSFDGVAWATKHDSSFKDLIASARKSRLQAKRPALEHIHDQTEENPGNPVAIESNDPEISEKVDELTFESQRHVISNHDILFDATATTKPASEEVSAGPSLAAVAKAPARAGILESGLSTLNLPDTGSGSR